jgi:predicted nuclease of predicted toxin-antitoxin system
MKFLADMNLSPRWVAALTGAGWHAEHWSELGKADANDLEILSYAACQ